MSEIKIVFIDVDGTLLLQDETVSPGNTAALQAAASRGIMVVLASGRGMHEAMRAAGAAGCRDYLVLVSGAQIYDIRAGETIYRKAIPRRIARETLHLLEGFQDIYFHAYIGREMVTAPRIYACMDAVGFPPAYVDYAKSAVLQAEDIEAYMDKKGEECEKFYISSPNHDAIAAIRQALETLGGMYVVAPNQRSVEATAQAVDKGSAIRFLLERLGIVRKQAMVIGDSENDLAMFREGGIRVAVGNACPELRRQADYIAPPYDADGVAEAVRRFVLQ